MDCAICTAPLAADGAKQYVCRSCKILCCSDCVLEYMRFNIQEGKVRMGCPGTGCTDSLAVLRSGILGVHDLALFVSKHVMDSQEESLSRVSEKVSQLEQSSKTAVENDTQFTSRVATLARIKESGLAEKVFELREACASIETRMQEIVQEIVDSLMNSDYDAARTLVLVPGNPAAGSAGAASKLDWGNSFSLCLLCKNGTCGPDEPSKRTACSYMCSTCARVSCTKCRQEAHPEGSTCVDEIAQTMAVFRPCPTFGCATLSVREWGCSQVFCGQCLRFWNFDTGNRSTDRNHHTPDSIAYLQSRGIDPSFIRAPGRRPGVEEECKTDLQLIWESMSKLQQDCLAELFGDLCGRYPGMDVRQAFESFFARLSEAFEKQCRQTPNVVIPMYEYAKRTVIAHVSDQAMKTTFKNRIRRCIVGAVEAYEKPRFNAEVLEELKSATLKLFIQAAECSDLRASIAEWGNVMDRMHDVKIVSEIHWPHREGPQPKPSSKRKAAASGRS